MKKINSLLCFLPIFCLYGCIMSPAPTGYQGIYGYGNFYKIDCECNDILTNLSTFLNEEEYFLFDSTHYDTAYLYEKEGVTEVEKAYYISDSNKIDMGVQYIDDTLHISISCFRSSLCLISITSINELKDESKAVIKKEEYLTFFEEKMLPNLCSPRWSKH